jgi:hypothetical protein
LTEYDPSAGVTDKSEQAQFQLPEDVEKRFQELEKKEQEEAKSDSPSAASAADSDQGQGQLERVNPADSQQEISTCFEAAIKKLDKVESDAEKKKSEIVRELARDLEGKMPTDEIAAEIVHQLRGRISERRIYECLEGEQYAKYKKKHRVENARKRQGRKDQAELAAEPQLKEEVAVQASGQETVLKPTRSPEENLVKTQGEGSGSGIDTGTSPPQPKCGANDRINVEISGSTAVEFSVPFESLRQRMTAAFDSNNSVNRVWFTGKFIHKTGEVVDIRIGEITDTNTTKVKKESKTSVVLSRTQG